MRLVVAVMVFAVGFSKSASAEDWKPPQTIEIVELAAAESLVVVDVLQTLDLKRHPDRGLYEVNPLLGRHPSDGRLLAMGGLSVLATTATWYALPARCRWVVPLFLAIGESFIVYGNAQAGMTVRF